METVVIAAGSNLGNRLHYLEKAGRFLEALSSGLIKKSSVWESEPVGNARYTFYNTAAVIQTSLEAVQLLKHLKEFERECGREKNPRRWGPRVLDLDIIGFGNLVIERESLIIPHPEYHRRLFVLYPMLEIIPEWVDPDTGKHLSKLIDEAPELEIKKTDLNW